MVGTRGWEKPADISLSKGWQQMANRIRAGSLGLPCLSGGPTHIFGGGGTPRCCAGGEEGAAWRQVALPGVSSVWSSHPPQVHITQNAAFVGTGGRLGAAQVVGR